IPPARAGSSATTAKVCPAGAGSCDWKRDTSARNGEAQAARAPRARVATASLIPRAITPERDGLKAFMARLLRTSGAQSDEAPQPGAGLLIDVAWHTAGGLNSA